MTTLNELAKSLHTTTDVLKEAGKADLPLLPVVHDDADLPEDVVNIIVAAWEGGPVTAEAAINAEPVDAVKEYAHPISEAEVTATTDPVHGELS